MQKNNKQQQQQQLKWNKNLKKTKFDEIMYHAVF